MPLLRFKLKDDLLVTCVDCEFYVDCEDVPEDCGVCKGFKSREEA